MSPREERSQSGDPSLSHLGRGHGSPSAAVSGRRTCSRISGQQSAPPPTRCRISAPSRKGPGTGRGLGSQGAGRSKEGPGQGREDNDRTVTEREEDSRNGRPQRGGLARGLRVLTGASGENSRPSRAHGLSSSAWRRRGEPRATADTTLRRAGTRKRGRGTPLGKGEPLCGGPAAESTQSQLPGPSGRADGNTDPALGIAWNFHSLQLFFFFFCPAGAAQLVEPRPVH